MSGFHHGGVTTRSALCTALSLSSPEQDSREVKIRRLWDEQGEETSSAFGFYTFNGFSKRTLDAMKPVI